MQFPIIWDIIARNSKLIKELGNADTVRKKLREKVLLPALLSKMCAKKIQNAQYRWKKLVTKYFLAVILAMVNYTPT
jgi:hypothetical protein